MLLEGHYDQNVIKLYQNSKALFDHALVVFITALYLKLVTCFLFLKWVDKRILRVPDSRFYSMFDHIICNIYIC